MRWVATRDGTRAAKSVMVRRAAAAFGMAACSAFLALGAMAGPNDTDQKAEQKFEIPVGGLIFAPNSALALDRQDVTLSSESVIVTYAIRNSDSSDQAITVSFPLADLDAGLNADTAAALASANPANFLDFVITVDGQRAAHKIEQRAIAVGLDVTKAIQDAGLPLSPLGEDMARKLVELSPEVRTDLVERGILKADDDVLMPAWVIKTTAYWRQVFASEQTLVLSLSYKPIVARNPYSSGAILFYKKNACVDAAVEKSVTKLASEGAPLTMVTMGYSHHPGAEALGPVGRFRLTIDKPDIKTVVATCRDGLVKTGPTTSDWSATGYQADEEFRFLFIR
jgi:hypothetical protein